MKKYALGIDLGGTGTKFGLVTERSARLAADIAAVNASLPSYKRFNRLVVRDSDFPRTPSMKILRHARYAK